MNLTNATWQSWDIIALEGSFDLRELNACRDCFESLRSKTHFKVILDLSKTTMVDSSAIGLIISFHKSAIEKNAVFVVIGANDDIQDVFDMTGLNTIVTIFRTMEEFEKSNLSRS